MRLISHASKSVFSFVFINSLVSGASVLCLLAAIWSLVSAAGGDGLAPVLIAAYYLPLLVGPLLVGRLHSLVSLRAAWALSAALAAVVFAGVAALFVLDLVGPGILLWAFFMLGLCQAFEIPSRQVALGRLVNGEKFRRVVAFYAVVANLSRTIFPAVGAGLIAYFPQVCFLTSAVAYLGLLIFVCLVRFKDEDVVAPRDESRLPRQSSGISFFLPAVVCLALVGSLANQFPLTNALISQQLFDNEGGMLGRLAACFSFGALAGAFVSAYWRFPSSLGILMGISMLFGTVQASVVLARDSYGYGCVLVVLGFLFSLITTVTLDWINANGERHKVVLMAWYNIAVLGLLPVGSFLVVLVSDLYGAIWAVAGPGILVVVTSVAALLTAYRSSDVRGARRRSER